MGVLSPGLSPVGAGYANVKDIDYSVAIDIAWNSNHNSAVSVSVV